MSQELAVKMQIDWLQILQEFQKFICGFMSQIDNYVNSLPPGTEKTVLTFLATILKYICEV